MNIEEKITRIDAEDPLGGYVDDQEEMQNYPPPQTERGEFSKNFQNS